MLSIDQRLRIAVNNCLVEHQIANIHTIRKECMEIVAEAKVEDINAALVDMISEGTVDAASTVFFLRGKVIPR